MDNKIKIIAVFSSFMMILFAAMCMASNDYSFVKVSVNSISPNPVEPGQDFTFQLRLTNYGSGETKNMSAVFQENPVFILNGKNDEFDNGFSLCSGCSKDNSFYLSVDRKSVV